MSRAASPATVHHGLDLARDRRDSRPSARRCRARSTRCPPSNATSLPSPLTVPRTHGDRHPAAVVDRHGDGHAVAGGDELALGGRLDRDARRLDQRARRAIARDVQRRREIAQRATALRYEVLGASRAIARPRRERDHSSPAPAPCATGRRGRATTAPPESRSGSESSALTRRRRSRSRVLKRAKVVSMPANIDESAPSTTTRDVSSRTESMITPFRWRMPNPCDRCCDRLSAAISRVRPTEQRAELADVERQRRRAAPAKNAPLR